MARFWHVGKRITREGIRRGDTLALLDGALTWFRAQVIPVWAVVTDNGTAHTSNAWRRHLRTRSYTPSTNGKAECFIQILLHNRAYAIADSSSAHRMRTLVRWPRWYNWQRSNASLGGLPPVRRVSRVCGRHT